VTVVDTSVLAVALGDDGTDGAHARQRLRGEVLAAPELIHPQVLSVLRRGVAGGAMTAHARRAPHRPLLRRCWELRHNVTSFDACYVALAEILDVTLLTADRRLANAPGLQCSIAILS